MGTILYIGSPLSIFLARVGRSPVYELSVHCRFYPVMIICPKYPEQMMSDKAHEIETLGSSTMSKINVLSVPFRPGILFFH